MPSHANVRSAGRAPRISFCKTLQIRRRVSLVSAHLAVAEVAWRVQIIPTPNLTACKVLQESAKLHPRLSSGRSVANSANNIRFVAQNLALYPSAVNKKRGELHTKPLPQTEYRQRSAAESIPRGAIKHPPAYVRPAGLFLDCPQCQYWYGPRQPVGPRTSTDARLLQSAARGTLARHTRPHGPLDPNRKPNHRRGSNPSATFCAP